MPPLEFELLPSTASPSGLPRLRFKPANLKFQAYADVPAPDQSAPNNSRLQDIVSRVGEICLSPELACVMLFPVHAHAFQSSVTTQENFPEGRRAACFDPDLILEGMDDLSASSASLTQAGKFLAKFQLDSLPVPVSTTHRQPIHLCAWRLDLPSRVCLYTGEHPKDPSALDLSTFSPHTLSKVLLEERSRRPSPSRVHLLSPEDISPSAIRTSLLHYAQTALTPYKARTLQSTLALDHTLEEALACLIHAPTRNHTEIELHQSPPWDKDHIDSRYGQTARHSRAVTRPLGFRLIARGMEAARFNDLVAFTRSGGAVTLGRLVEHGHHQHHDPDLLRVGVGPFVGHHLVSIRGPAALGDRKELDPAGRVANAEASRVAGDCHPPVRGRERKSVVLGHEDDQLAARQAHTHKAVGTSVHSLQHVRPVLEFQLERARKLILDAGQRHDSKVIMPSSSRLKYSPGSRHPVKKNDFSEAQQPDIRFPRADTHAFGCGDKPA